MGRNKSYIEEQVLDFLAVKKNLSQNVRIARKLNNMKTSDAGPKLGIEPHSLRRIESINDSHYPSLEVLCGAIELYNQEPNFYWRDWRENQKMLDDFEKRYLKEDNVK